MKTIANFYFLNKIDLIVPQNNLFKVLDNDRIIENSADGEISNTSSPVNIIPYLQKALKYFYLPVTKRAKVSYKIDLLVNILHVYLPIDLIIADNMNKDANIKEQFAKKNTINCLGLEIRRKSIYEFIKVINRSLSIFWNGPLRVNFSNRTLSIINTIKNVNSKGAFSMVGGDYIKKKNKDKISYISTEGDVMLAALKGKIISGVDLLLITN